MDVVALQDRRNMPLVIIGQDRISAESAGGAKIHQLPLQFLATASLWSIMGKSSKDKRDVVSATTAHVVNQEGMANNGLY